MDNKKEISIPDEVLMNKIYFIRGQKVLLDEDLANLYQVLTKRLNEQVKRNKERFPPDFMFQLNKIEFEDLKSQIATSSWGGRRKLPFAFTEHGILMLSSVLKSKRAVAINIQIMRIFVKLRTILLTHTDLLLRVNQVERQLINHGEDIHSLFEYVDELLKDRAVAEKQANRKKIGFKK